MTIATVSTTVQPFSPNLVTDVRQMLDYAFMRHAFLAGTMVAIVAGLVGFFVVTRQLTFAGEALSHVAFAGAMGAVVVGLNPLVGLFGATVLAACGLTALGEQVEHARARDVTIGILLAWTLGLGALFLGIYTVSARRPNSSLGVGVLFGSIFGVSADQAVLIAIVALATILVLLAIARPLLFASLDPEVALARGLPVRALGALFLILVGVTVADAVPTVGALLIFALLITPAATARLLVARPFAALALSALLGLLSTWVGLFLAFYRPYPVSFDITIVGFVLYLAALVWRRLRSVSDQRHARASTSSVSG